MLTARLKAWWIQEARIATRSASSFPAITGPGWPGRSSRHSRLPPVSTISDAMGLPCLLGVDHLWLSSPTHCRSIGLRMRHGGSAYQDMTVRLVKRDWWGLYFQAAGHGLACFLLVMLEISAGHRRLHLRRPERSTPGSPSCSRFMVWPWMEGTLVLCCQALRKLDKGEQMELTGGVP
jgi:hypothetical protein